MSEEIPPPLIPGHRHSPDEQLMIPFNIANLARLQLEYLSRTRALSDTHRKTLSTWLSQYNSYLSNYILENYGPSAVQYADEVSRQTVNRMNDKITETHEKAARDIFERLEGEFHDE